MNIKKITDNFKKFEEDNNVFKKNMKSYPLWLLIRTDVFQYIFNKNNNGIDLFPNKFSLFKNFFNIFLRSLYSFIFLYKFIFFKNIIFIDSRKNIKVKNKIYNSYIESLISKFDLNINDILIVERNHKYELNFLDYKYKNVIPFDFFLIMGFIYSNIRKITIKYFPFNFLKSNLSKKKYNNLLKIYFFKKSILEFSYIFNKLFLKNKKVYFYLQESFFYIFYFNKNNIYEMQHGIIPNINLGYIFPKNQYTQNFINNKNFYVYNNITKNILIEAGYNNNNIVVIGKPEIDFHFKYIKNINLKRNQKSILIIEQPINDFYEIINDLESFAKNNKNCKIGLAIHPGSNFNYKKSLFEVHRGKNIYNLLNQYKNIISLNSTVILEAKYFNCNIITTYKDYDKTYDEYVKPLIGGYKKHIHIESGKLKNKKINDIIKN